MSEDSHALVSFAKRSLSSLIASHVQRDGLKVHLHFRDLEGDGSIVLAPYDGKFTDQSLGIQEAIDDWSNLIAALEAYPIRVSLLRHGIPVAVMYRNHKAESGIRKYRLQKDQRTARMKAWAAENEWATSRFSRP